MTVNVDASGSNVQGNGRQGKALGQAIGAAVQAELITKTPRRTSELMATFSFTPTHGTQKPVLNVRIAQFGSGYSQRSTFSINQNKSYGLTFEMSETVADDIELFLDQRGGTENFDFTPAGN